MYLNLHCVARSTVAGETRPLISPAAIPRRAHHCSAMPSWESKPLVSAIFPSGPGTLYRLAVGEDAVHVHQQKADSGSFVRQVRTHTV